VVQGEGPEFKPQYCKKPKQTKLFIFQGNKVMINLEKQAHITSSEHFPSMGHLLYRV
jgi:hypothetical protein